MSSIPTSEEGSHGTSSREHKTAIGRGATHSSKDLQDVGVIRTKPENLTSKKGTEEGKKVTITSNYFATIEDLDEYAVGHLLKFLTADDVMALGQTSSKWLVICGPLMKKKALETGSNTVRPHPFRSGGRHRGVAGGPRPPLQPDLHEEGRLGDC